MPIFLLSPSLVHGRPPTSVIVIDNHSHFKLIYFFGCLWAIASLINILRVSDSDRSSNWRISSTCLSISSVKETDTR